MKDTDIPKKVRIEVLERDSCDGWPCCIYCGRPNALHVHHVKRRSQGGKGELRNLVLLCNVCHTKLHAGDLEIKNYTESYLKERYGESVDM